MYNFFERGLIMKSKLFKAVALALAALTVLSCLSVGAFAQESYTIESPYEKVVWEGENAWGAYKGSLHSHSTYSDATETLSTMVKEAYYQDYDFLCVSDHGITGVEWNKTPDMQLLYYYQPIIGYTYEHLTDEEYAAITSGSYPLENGQPRNKPMTCITGGNEFNYISLTKNHVNGHFLPADKGNGFPGGENEYGYEQAVKYIHENGGLSYINHPGDWLQTNQNHDAVNDEENIKFFGDLILKYSSCLGMEVFNEENGTTGYDRILWDNLLMYCLPYGKTIIGFSNTDAHEKETVDSSFSVFMMEKNDVDHIRETMQTGTSFMVTRKIRKNETLGPAEDIDVMKSGLPYPMFKSLTVDNHSVSISAVDCHTVKWIANGEIIAEKTIEEGETVLNHTIDLDALETVKNPAELEYVRAELYGEGGLCLSQALVIDNGEADLKFEAEERSLLDNFILYFKSTKLWAIINELILLIND